MDLQYLVREPQNITPETPVLFLLHGYGSNEEDLFSFVPTLPEDWLVISFRAPKDSSYGGYAWFDIDFNNAENFVDENEANEAVKLVLENIMGVTNRYGLTDNKTHLCGFSQGGMIAYSLALQYPDLFSKVACLSSYPEEKLLNNIDRNKKKYENMRFFISHGTEDVVLPIELGRMGDEFLKSLNINFEYHEYRSGHGIVPQNYYDLMDWIKRF